MIELQTKPKSANPFETPSLTQGGLVARHIDAANGEEVIAYQRLRYECFVLNKGWVKANPAHTGREMDCYDIHCHHLGVFQGPHLIAYLRALPWRPDPGFMLEHEFRTLLTEDAAAKLPHVGSVELSRLVVTPATSSGHGGRLEVAELLFKLVYRLGKCWGWAAYYIVLEESWLRILNRRFNLPFIPLGVPYIFPDGTRTVAASGHCTDIERVMRETLPDKYEWYVRRES